MQSASGDVDRSELHKEYGVFADSLAQAFLSAQIPIDTIIVSRPDTVYLPCDCADTTTTNPGPDPVDPIPPDSSGIKTFAYLATWDYNVGGHGNWGVIRRDEVDWDAFTHGILFASGVSATTCQPTQPGAWENVSPDRINAFVTDAQANQKKALMSLGGAGNSSGLISCLNNNPELLAQNLNAYMDQWGFDGIDIDAEPTGQVDPAGNLAFAQRFKELAPDKMLIAAINGGFDAMANASAYYDHINYMTYDLSGAWQGWYSWHNAAIYNPSGGSSRVNIPGSNTEYPNIESILNEMVSAGIPEEKVGFGISVDGYVWTGVTAPEQDAAGATRTYAPQDITYLTQDYGEEWQWDAAGQASYLSGNNTFVSVDNARAIRAKFDYARSKGINSIILWKYTTYQPVIEELKAQQ